MEIGNIAPKVAEPPSDQGRCDFDAFAKEAARVSKAYLKTCAPATFPEMLDSFKQLAEAFDEATPADVEEGENQFARTVTPLARFE